MRTRRATYPTPSDGIIFSIRPLQHKRRRQLDEELGTMSKQTRFANSRRGPVSGFDALHDDLLISIMVAVSSTATSPADLINAVLTCKRFCAAATHTQVLASASVSGLAVKASGWSDGAQRFLKQCADAGNAEACYILGMIRFYCIMNHVGGTSLMAKAAMSSHAPALHSLAVIQFNGSGGTRKDKDLKAGVALCARAASLGHVDAMRELGHCLQDGYGVTKNVNEGRRLLLEANALEAAAAVAASPQAFMETAFQLGQSSGVGCLQHHLQNHSARTKLAVAQRVSIENALVSGGDIWTLEYHPILKLLHGGGCSLLSDFGCNVPQAKLHVASKFLVDWFGMHPPAAGLRLCSHVNCGRSETRRYEFRRCSACSSVNYCSRACQALDWKLQHKYNCTRVEAWENHGDSDGEDDDQQMLEVLFNS